MREHMNCPVDEIFKLTEKLKIENYYGTVERRGRRKVLAGLIRRFKALRRSFIFDSCEDA